MTDKHKESHELSSAGMRRREQMLPLLQDAVRGRTRRRRQRRMVAGSLLLLLVTLGLFQLLEDGDRDLDRVDAYLADGSSDSRLPSVSLDTIDVPTAGGLDISSLDQDALYARVLERSPGLFVTTPDRLPASARTLENRVVVEYLTTDQLMAELSIEGVDSAVICSRQGCTLFTSGGRNRAADGEVNAAIGRVARSEAMSNEFVSPPSRRASVQYRDDEDRGGNQG